MGQKIKKLKKMRIHREGTDTLIYGFIVIAAIALLLYRLDTKIPFWAFIAIFGVIYGVVINFFR
ncbi:MAG: phosphatidylserine decarboxylase family protein, partial [Prevotella sp.]|nr:phosphatidylserine decarboxylase family protein [Prevotella sp.]